VCVSIIILFFSHCKPESLLYVIGRKFVLWTFLINFHGVADKNFYVRMVGILFLYDLSPLHNFTAAFTQCLSSKFNLLSAYYYPSNLLIKTAILNRNFWKVQSVIFFFPPQCNVRVTVTLRHSRILHIKFTVAALASRHLDNLKALVPGVFSSDVDRENG
jgi:hypothetical protein